MDSALALAEAAIEKGEYELCLKNLGNLIQSYSINTDEGAKIRMMMITAYMGKGEDDKAKSMCRKLTRCKNTEQRQIAKQLLSVLDSPKLERPENWSIKLPVIEFNSTENSNFYSKGKKKMKKETIYIPPTGPTKNLGIGFSILVFITLTFLTILLSGCVKIRTELNFPAQDRVQLNVTIKNSSKKLLSWQTKFQNSLQSLYPKITHITSTNGKQIIRTRILKSSDANEMLQKISYMAAESAGIDLAAPQLSLKEKNWLIGVKQDIKLEIDLKDLPEIPGLKLELLFNSKNLRDVKSSPLQINQSKEHSLWEIKEGKLNFIQFHQWKWSPLGVGILVIIIALGLTITLQKLRLDMGFGYPELPP